MNNKMQFDSLESMIEALKTLPLLCCTHFTVPFMDDEWCVSFLTKHFKDVSEL